MYRYKKIVQEILFTRLKDAGIFGSSLWQIKTHAFRYGQSKNLNAFGTKELKILEDLYIHWKYYFPITFLDFVLYILDIPEDVRYYRPKIKKSSYRRKKEHVKKVLNEADLAKKEWRKKKKRNDSRSKKNHFNYSDYNRENNNRSLRRWTKNRIKHEDYDLEKGWRGWKHFDTEWLW